MKILVTLLLAVFCISIHAGVFEELVGVDAPKHKTEKIVNKLLAEKKYKHIKLDVLARNPGKSLLVFEKLGADDILVPREFVEKISKELKISSILIGIYDGDYWWYEFYKDGNKMDEFSSNPDYWKKLSEKEQKELQGKPEIFEKNWNYVKKKNIDKYFIQRNGKGYNPKEKAYPGDSYPYNDVWQMVDFMKKLGIDYPEEEN